MNIVQRIEVEPDQWILTSVVLAEANLREGALLLARKRGAYKRFAYLTRIFAEVDGPAVTAERDRTAPKPRAPRKWQHL